MNMQIDSFENNSYQNFDFDTKPQMNQQEPILQENTESTVGKKPRRCNDTKAKSCEF